MMDAIRAFIAHQRGRFGRIYAFEPDTRNCELLRAYVTSLVPTTAMRIQIFNAGVGSRREKLRFDQAGNMSSAFSNEGGIEVEVLPIDRVVEISREPVFLKFDVEGAEWEALQGCERLIAQTCPIMAISVYHRPDDLWQLPLYVAAQNLDYRFYLRTQGEDGMDVISYCVPAKMTGL